jgi:hypothetical protein
MYKSHKHRIKNCNKILKNKQCMCLDKNNNLQSKSCLNEKKKKCKKYRSCKRYFNKFMSGYEPLYRPKHWSKPLVEKSHNCYAYALNDHYPSTIDKCKKHHKSNNNYKGCSDYKPQPGYFSNSFNKYKKKFTCKNMVNKIKHDNKSLKLTSFNRKCPKRHYKAAIVVDPDNTYHFYRQDKSLNWSHKPGVLPITNKDASNEMIFVPHLSDRNYNKSDNGGINYTDFCSYFCVPNNNYIKTNAK